jgi:hypothetical protein
MKLKDPKNGRTSKVRSLVNRYIHHHRIRIKARNNHDLDTYRIHHDSLGISSFFSLVFVDQYHNISVNYNHIKVTKYLTYSNPTNYLSC